MMTGVGGGVSDREAARTGVLDIDLDSGKMKKSFVEGSSRI